MFKELADVVVLVFILVVFPQLFPVAFCMPGKSHLLALAFRTTGCCVLLTMLGGDFSGISDKFNGSAIELCEILEVFVLTLGREWEGVLVTVVEVGEKGICTWLLVSD